MSITRIPWPELEPTITAECSDRAWIFRGEGHFRVSLTSTFDRFAGAADVNTEDRWKYEAWMLREFRRRADRYLNRTEVPEMDNRLEWLSLMRHYGAPCRLVDFTYSRHVADYFALREAAKEFARDPNCLEAQGVIFAIDLKELRLQAEKQIVNWWNNNNPHYILTAWTGKLDLHRPEMFTKYVFEQSGRKGIAPVTPYRLNDRITQQQGTFLCPRDISVPFSENLNALDNLDSMMKKWEFKITKTQIKEAFGKLRSMNITFASLFPDLSGYAQWLDDACFLLHVPGEYLDNLTAAITYGADPI
ncbi:MAG: FRG domain-containing protein [Deltaproteobacteria bacterium]|nr:FRG domain-containing protein [Deltaproteobacteria bacterium]